MGKHRTFDSYTVYLIRWANGEPAYIGYTGRDLETRRSGHIYTRKKFYKQHDITIEPLMTYETKHEAEMEESRFQEIFFPGESTDRDKKAKGGVHGAKAAKFADRSKGGKKGGKIGGSIVTKRIYHHTCGTSVRTPGAAALHRKNCGCETTGYEVTS